MKTPRLLSSALMLSALLPISAFADESPTSITIKVTNLTHGIHFTPLLVAAHTSTTDIFEVGATASDNLQAMAEGGSLDGLEVDMINADATYVTNPAMGLLAPGQAVTTSLDPDGTDNNYLSVVGMMLPTNDGFIGLDSIAIPTEPGSYTFYLNAYDAGTEANDELLNPGAGGAPGVAGIPAAPGMDSGTGGTGAAGADSHAMIHVHRGVLGDTDAEGGNSDLDSRIHRWLNPVAKVELTISNP